MYALSDAERAGWGSWQTFGLLVLAGLGLVAFVAAEARVAHPLMPLSIFRRRDLVGANFVGFFLAAAVPAMIYLLTLHMQQGLGYSPMTTGLAFLPHAVVAFFAARVAPKVVDRFGARPTMAWGSALFGGSVLLLSGITPGGGYALQLLPALSITAVGILFGFLASMIAATSGMPDDEQGLASGLLQTSQQIGQALGLAVILNVVAVAKDHALAVGMEPPRAQVAGFRAGFLVEAGFAALAVVVALLVVRRSVAVPGGSRPVVPMH